MIKSLYSGITALQVNTAVMGVIGDNIANVGTTSFKGSAMTFENLLNQSVGGYTGQEVGSGVKVSNLSRDWTQGTIMNTGSVTDLAINGKGFFAVVEDPANTAVGSRYYTRAGGFHFDSNGYLLDNNGYYVLDETGAVIQDTNIASTTGVSISSDGQITTYNSATPSGTPLAKIGLATFPCNWGLAAMDSNLYKGTTLSGTPTLAAPPTGTSLSSYSLEMSNVDLASEFGKMITTQRSFQAAAKVITASDEVLQQLLGIKR